MRFRVGDALLATLRSLLPFLPAPEVPSSEVHLPLVLAVGRWESGCMHHRCAY